jgi:hypothetical protein
MTESKQVRTDVCLTTDPSLAEMFQLLNNENLVVQTFWSYAVRGAVRVWTIPSVHGSGMRIQKMEQKFK